MLCMLSLQVHHARVWDRPHDQPVLVLDDSLGTYMGSHRMSAAGGPRLSSAGQVRPEDILLGKRVLEVGFCVIRAHPVTEHSMCRTQ